jgi:AraC family transcriptional regulator, activator of mtrCDE
MSETPAADVLTNILRTLRLRVRLMSRGDYCGQWALDSGGRRNKATFHYVGRGEFWLHCASRGEPMHLKEGSLLFFPRPQWHQFSSTPVCQPRPSLGEKPKGDKPVTTVICCIVEFESDAHNPVLQALPDIVRVQCNGPEGILTELGTLARLLLKEHDQETPGHSAMLERIAEALFIEILRQQMQAMQELRGVLRALADPQLGRALSAMHAHPGREWDVTSLAEAASLSRSAFARRFGECLEMAPMQYLAQWRMHLADDLLRDPRRSVAQVAESLGYQTEAAFRTAFKRVRGVAPGSVRKSVT